MKVASSKPHEPNPPLKVVTSEAVHFPPFSPQAPPDGPESDEGVDGVEGLFTGADDVGTGAAGTTGAAASIFG